MRVLPQIHISPWECAVVSATSACCPVVLQQWCAAAVWQGLFAGAADALVDNGVLFTYGPYRGTVCCCPRLFVWLCPSPCTPVTRCSFGCHGAVDGLCTTPSNEEFDKSLKSRNALWGIRDIAECEAVANPHGLVLKERIDMPSNNFTLVWHRLPRV